MTTWNGLRRSPLSQQSRKRRKEQGERRKLIAKHVGEPCEIRWDDGCEGIGATLHEPLLRSRGGDPASEEGTIWTCGHCHSCVHLNPAEATRRGYMIHAWEG